MKMKMVIDCPKCTESSGTLLGMRVTPATRDGAFPRDGSKRIEIDYECFPCGEVTVFYVEHDDEKDYASYGIVE